MGTNLYLVLREHFFISKSKHSLFSLSSVAKENRLNKYGGSVCCLGRWIGLVIPCADRRNCLEKKIEAEGEKGKGQLGNEKTFTSAYSVKSNLIFSDCWSLPCNLLHERTISVFNVRPLRRFYFIT